jgi:SAM-dependent methyltransferase
VGGRIDVIDDLACPACAGSLAGRTVEGEGVLECESCGYTYPVVNGIPRLVPPDLPLPLRRTADAFGWQWLHFVEMHDRFEAQFLDWIHPLGPDDFRDRDVLDAGCGIGRHAFFAARYGARTVTAMDLSAAVETARRTLGDFGNARVVQGDILRPPFRNPDEGGGFDLVYSIGVLHHLPDPRQGFISLARCLRPGGTIAVWVYGHENNGFVRNVIEPARRVTTKIPPPFLRLVAWPLAAVFHGAVKLYGPTRGTRINRRLPLGEYVSSLADFEFRQNYTIVFDQLVAPTAAYIKGDELRSWFEEAGLEEIEISHRHGNSWRGRGQKPS